MTDQTRCCTCRCNTITFSRRSRLSIAATRARCNACSSFRRAFSRLIKDWPLKFSYVCFRLPNGHINFEKFWQLAKQVTEFIAWKQVACPFEKNPRVIAFLQASPVLTENSKQCPFLFSLHKIRERT